MITENMQAVGPEVVFGDRHFGARIAENDGLSVIWCDVCGFAHLFPLPDEKEVEAFYTEDKFYKDISWFEKEKREHEAGLWDAYYQYNVNLLPPGYLIDLGCGLGWFGKFWEDNVGLAWGIEPSYKALKWAYYNSTITFIHPDLDIWASYWGSSEGKKSIRACLLLEHLVNPKQYLLDLMPLIDDKILIIVPNEFNPLQKRIGGDWFVCEHHINYFNSEGMRNLLKSVGLKVTHESATFPMEIFPLIGLDYRGNDKLGRKCHMARLKFEKLLGVRAFKLYERLYKWFDIGRELIFVAEKI